MKNFILLFLFSVVIVKINAQSLHGVIYDNDGVTIPDVYLTNTTNTEHAHTNINGEFTITGIAIGDTLNISHIGYASTIFVVQNDEEIKITLPDNAVELNAVVISPSVQSLNVISKVDLLTMPVNSSQELLRKVPGLFIGQHAGGGKAEQMFLRGFDIDHGTDVAVTVDGVPVNMVSHAHGQGYADLHFVIPETIQFIDFGKGAYYADHGNLNTAAYIDFHTVERPEESIIKTEFGSFNTMRLVGLLNLLNTKNHHLYFAGENINTDGPFIASQNFRRYSGMIKYSGILANKDKIIFTASAFNSSWDASGQIPNRAVEEIGRFGAIDSTEGGNTGRRNIALQYNKYINRNTSIQNTIYFVNYDFELFSNFTYFLEDSINGDQIRQYENRNLYGGVSELLHEIQKGAVDITLKAAIGLRNDQVNEIGLSHTVNRTEELEVIQSGIINESNVYSYLDLEFAFGDFLINPGVRVDYFNFMYDDKTAELYTNESQSKAIVSPKFNLIYNPNNTIQYYFKSGMGFHSNDTRTIIYENVENALPKSIGSDLGVLWKPSQNVLVNVAVWTLFLEQEFVYVGDAGVVEPSGKTWRSGVDAGVRFQITKGLFMYSDFTYAYARSVDEEEGENYIPLAPIFTLTGGITYNTGKGFYGGLHYRGMGDRPANEDYSVVAKGYNVFDGNIGYAFSKIDIAFSVQNLLNTEWNETQFNTESRLYDEPAPVEEIHFTPGTPFAFKCSFQYAF